MADDYKEGSMDITEQEKTFNGFIQFTKWGVILVVLVLLFLAVFNS